MNKTTLIFILAPFLISTHAEVSSKIKQDWHNQYEELQTNIQKKNIGTIDPIAEQSIEIQIPKNQVLDTNSMILDSDKDALDVQIRRSELLLKYLRSLPEPPANLIDLESQFQNIKNGSLSGGTGLAKVAAGRASRSSLFQELNQLTREAALSNPLLDFDDLLFVERSTWADLEPNRHEPKGGHQCDQYHGHNGRPGGGLYILKDFQLPSAQLVNVVEGLRVPSGTHAGKLMSEGAFISPDLSWDGQTIVFGWSAALGFATQWVTENRFHIFKVNIDGSGLTRLTDGDYDDFDPVWLPNGRLAFISTRRGGYLRCGGDRFNPTYTLYGMKADGSDIITLSFHETNEWHPSVNNDGMIVYTRWDYVDREDCIAHHIWTCYPDGRNPRAPHGNYPVPMNTLTGTSWPDGRTRRPFAEFNIRSIPGSKKYIATAGPHHGQAYGSIVMIDTRIEDDNMMSQVKRITPTVPFPEAETPVQDHHPYGTAWPLSEGFYMVNYQDGIYLLDSLGNRTLLYQSTANKFRPLDPIPVRARQLPPVIPTQTHQGENLTPQSPNAVISIMNVYTSDQVGKLPPGTVIKDMRIVQIIPKSNHKKDVPRTSHFDESLVRIPLGTVPVESDGSVYSEAPVNKAIYFQLLDDKGIAIQSMRSATYVHPGEHLSCTGCHESKWEATPVTPNPIAMQRPPSKLAPEIGPIEPMNFYRVVKPVFDDNCVNCHQGNAGPDMSYASLTQPLLFGFPGSQRDNYTVAKFGGSRTTPGKFGTYESTLYKNGYLNSTHYNVSLTNEELRRITLWLDLNSNELGAYINEAAQRSGELVWPVHDVDPSNPTGVENRVVKVSHDVNGQNLKNQILIKRETDNLRIELPESGPSTIIIHDLSGKEWLNKKTKDQSFLNNSQNLYVKIKNYPLGIYFIKVQVAGKQYGSKFTILKQ